MGTEGKFIVLPSGKFAIEGTDAKNSVFGASGECACCGPDACYAPENLAQFSDGREEITFRELFGEILTGGPNGYYTDTDPPVLSKGLELEATVNLSGESVFPSGLGDTVEQFTTLNVQVDDLDQDPAKRRLVYSQIQREQNSGGTPHYNLASKVFQNNGSNPSIISQGQANYFVALPQTGPANSISSAWKIIVRQISVDFEVTIDGVEYSWSINAFGSLDGNCRTVLIQTWGINAANGIIKPLP